LADVKTLTISHHLGIDAGGTSTRAVVLGPDGHCVGHGRAGSGNPISSGTHVAAASLRSAAGQALLAAGLPGEAISSTAVAMAGGSRVAEDDEAGEAIRGAIQSTGVHAPLTVEPDLLALYFSGTSQPSGYALVSGTGAAAVRVVEGEVAATCDGLGWLLGDEGSGFWIGREVARAVSAALDGRGPATALTALLLDAVPADDPPSFKPVAAAAVQDPNLRHLVRRLYAVPPVHLARFAPLAFAAVSASGDAVAVDIITRAGLALANTLSTVLAPELDGPIILGGGVLVSQDLVGAVVRSSLGAAHRHGPVVAVTDGLVGAGVLALRRAGLDVDPTTFATVTTSLAHLR
jgi:glucosamine kinase